MLVQICYIKSTVVWRLRIIIGLISILSKQLMSISSKETQIRDGKWSDEEHHLFLEGLRLYGKNWKLIEKIVTTRSGAQIRSHAQKYFNKLDRHRQVAWNPDNSSELPDNKGSPFSQLYSIGQPNRIRFDNYFFHNDANLGPPRLRSKLNQRSHQKEIYYEDKNRSTTKSYSFNPSFYPEYLVQEENISSSQQSPANQSYWAVHIQPLLFKPQIFTNFLRMTTVVDFDNCRFREKKRKDSSFTNLHEDETETGRNIEGCS